MKQTCRSSEQAILILTPKSFPAFMSPMVWTRPMISTILLYMQLLMEKGNMSNFRYLYLSTSRSDH